ncbi:hypothetical protein PT974_04737 [Cladobotryum mycophilum]|uniref:CFEM domain-containing protein n=1 Tax=Cladobotryum mycophilum TaxID=491253 RepID=A0ABR0SRC4_9HYPO
MQTTFVILAAAGLAAAQFGNTPQCALKCLAPAIPATGCASTDIACLCAHKDQLQTAITPCVQVNCTPAEIQQTITALNSGCSN